MIVPRKAKLNLGRIVYEAYPDHDLLPIDMAKDCRNLQTLYNLVTEDNLGDGLFSFLVIEMVQGGGGTLDGAVRAVERARDDVDAVLGALREAQSRRCRKGRLP
jgi:hypothetical protein